MSGALWFAEGITSYYTNLILCRAGLITPEKYVTGLNGTFNYVWNSPARTFFNPIEMSYQAPFVDAATSVDPVNRENTFISYYSYGSVLGLALDLALREKGLNLDDYMKQVWMKYGADEVPYTLQNLQKVLNDYAGENFSRTFFSRYIHKSEMPNYEELFKAVGIKISQNLDHAYFGAAVAINDTNKGEIRANTKIGGPAYTAGLDKGDQLLSINGTPFPSAIPFNIYIKQNFQPGDSLSVVFERFGEQKTTEVILENDPSYIISLMEENAEKPTKKILKNRKAWLKIE
jgi:predicted metalloprotease with PDZ domain